MADTFQRARSDEQRAIRRQAILEVAAGMLQEMPVADVSLNELSRRVGLAKSNVLRYFDSREAVLLELLASLVHDWLEDLAGLIGALNPKESFDDRAQQFAAAFARSLAERPVLCDVMSAQASVLEHNVSSEAIGRYKRGGLADAERLTGLIGAALPELTTEDAWRLAMGANLMATAVWIYSSPPQALVDLYEQEPELAALHLEFAATLERYVVTLALGLHAA